MEEKKVSKTGNKYYEVILDWFRQQILSGQMKEGDTIPSERELAAQFGVSRVPVREALRILEYIGIISNGADGMIIQRVDVQLLHRELILQRRSPRKPSKICLKCGSFWSPLRHTMQHCGIRMRILNRSAMPLQPCPQRSTIRTQTAKPLHVHPMLSICG